MLSLTKFFSAALAFSLLTPVSIKASDRSLQDGKPKTRFATTASVFHKPLETIPEEDSPAAPSASLPATAITITSVLPAQSSAQAREIQLLDIIAMQSDDAGSFPHYKAQLAALDNDALELIYSQGLLKYVLGKDAPLMKAEGWLKKAIARQELRRQNKVAFPLPKSSESGVPPLWSHNAEDQSFLTEVMYSGRRFGMFPQEIFSFPTLTKLTLSGTGLVVLPPQIATLVNLVTLDLTNNSLFWIAPEVGTMKLQHLCLTRNAPLKHLPATLGQPELKELVIDERNHFDAATQQLFKTLVGRGVKLLVPEAGRETSELLRAASTVSLTRPKRFSGEFLNSK